MVKFAVFRSEPSTVSWFAVFNDSFGQLSEDRCTKLGGMLSLDEELLPPPRNTHRCRTILQHMSLSSGLGLSHFRYEDHVNVLSLLGSNE